MIETSISKYVVLEQIAQNGHAQILVDTPNATIDMVNQLIEEGLVVRHEYEATFHDGTKYMSADCYLTEKGSALLDECYSAISAVLAPPRSYAPDTSLRVAHEITG